MQPSQVKEYFPSVKRRIDNAAQLGQITKDVPDELRDSLSELGRESDQAMQALEQERNDERIRQCVGKLAKLGDRTMQVCRQRGNVDWEVESAVREAHDALDELRQRLH